MGLARYDSQSCTIHPDPELTWHVPQEWNLQDAVTVPYAYTTVCIFLTILTTVRIGYTAVRNACTTMINNPYTTACNANTTVCNYYTYYLIVPT